jgi:hypothetical protein
MPKRQTMVLLVAGGAIAALGITFLVADPFGREQAQVAELRTLGESEQKASSASSELKSYVKEEKTLRDVDEALAKFQAASIASPSAPPSSPAFDTQSLEREEQELGSMQSFIDFVAKEREASIIDSSLKNF